MSTKYAIETEFLLLDHASQALDKIGFSAGILKKTVGLSMLKAQERMEVLGKKALAASASFAKTAAFMAGNEILNATKSYIAFDDAITAAGAKFIDLDTTSATFKDDLTALQNKALEVSGATKFTAQDAAGALDKMAMAGLTASQSMGMLKGTASLASAVGLDLTSAVDMATDAMGAFNLMKDEMGTPLDTVGIERSMNRVADVVARATNMANLSMTDWFESVRFGAPKFTALGGQIEEFSAMTGILANSGLKGSIAGTGINAIMERLAAPPEKGGAMAALEKLGISVFDTEGKMRSFTDILGQFEKKLNGMSDAEKAPLMKNIFGEQGGRAFEILISAGTKELGRYTDALNAAGGAAGNMAGTMNNSLKGQITLISSALDTIRIKIGKSMSEAGGLEILERLRKFISNFDAAPMIAAFSAAFEKIGQVILGVVDYLKEAGEIGDFLSFAGLTEFIRNIDIKPIVEGIGNFIIVLTNLFSFAANHTGLILGIGKAWLFMQGVLMASAGIEKVNKTLEMLKLSVSGIRGGFVAVKDGATIASAALQGFSGAAQVTSQMASPMGRTFGTVFTKAGAIALKAGGAMKSAFASIGTSFLALGGTIKAFVTGTLLPLLANPVTWVILGIVVALVSIIVVAIKHLDELTAAFHNAGGGIEGIKAAVDTLFKKFDEMSGIGGVVLNILVKPLELLWGGVKGVIDIFEAFMDGGFLDGLKMFGLQIQKFILTPIQMLFDMLSLITGIGSRGKVSTWFDKLKAGFLPSSVEAEHLTQQPPTRTAVAASSYSREESVTTSDVRISLDRGLSASGYGQVAPAVTLNRGGGPRR